jgi:hypothetical protein
MLGGQNLDPVAGRDNMRQGHDATIEFGATATVTNFGVHLVGEIQHRRTRRKVDDLTTRRQHINPVLRGDRSKTVQQALIVEFVVR